MSGPDPGHINGAVFIPNCIAVRLIWKLSNGKQVSNVVHGAYTGAPPTLAQGDVDALGSTLKANFTSTMATYMSNQTQLVAVGIRDMAAFNRPDGTQVGRGEFISAGSPAAGADGTNKALPVNVAFVITLTTGLAGPQNRGRIYYGGWSSLADNSDSTVLQVAADSAKNFTTDLKTALSGFTPSLVLSLAHPARAAYDSLKPPFTHHAARGAGTVTVNDIRYRDLVWDTQRRRIRL